MPPIARGEAMASYCLSEPEAGSDAVNMKTRAVRDGDQFVLNGVKRWITNAGVSDFYTVFAVTDPGARSKGISAFVVEKSDDGVSFGAPEKKLGIKGSPTCEVYLDSVRIPESRLIGDEGTGFATAMQTLDHTRVTIAAQAIGIAQGALGLRAGLRAERKQFGKAIAEFQGLQFMLADMGMKLEAARQLTYAAAAKSERGDADLTYFGAAAKCFASDVAMEITTDAVQLLGGYGYTQRLPGRADDARRQDHPDLRGHQPGATDRDGPRALVAARAIALLSRCLPHSTRTTSSRCASSVGAAPRGIAVPTLSYFAYFSSSTVSPRATSANIAFALALSHSTAEPTGVNASELATGTVSVRPLPPAILRIALASDAVSTNVVSSPSRTALAAAVDSLQ